MQRIKFINRDVRHLKGVIAEYESRPQTKELVSLLATKRKQLKIKQKELDKWHGLKN